MEALKREPRYTYADYAEWELKEGERYEIIDGIPYAMSAPSVGHQRVSSNLLGEIQYFLRGRNCEVFHAPFDVRLNAKGDKDDTIVQPDLTVICDKSKLDDKGCNGAPDFVIEIISPSSSRHDRSIKFHKYQNAGVKEYWMVDLTEKSIDTAVLTNGRYEINSFSVKKGDDMVESAVLAEFAVDLNNIFTE
ncbi:MAG: Uma2 family endonuclease [Oscillospiraceae bacterium]|nr:Uma2 family endonuclease [Oscillospiraceae bacterium]